jgi:hypothetical protein
VRPWPGGWHVFTNELPRQSWEIAAWLATAGARLLYEAGLRGKCVAWLAAPPLYRPQGAGPAANPGAAAAAADKAQEELNDEGERPFGADGGWCIPLALRCTHRPSGVP